MDPRVPSTEVKKKKLSSVAVPSQAELFPSMDGAREKGVIG